MHACISALIPSGDNNCLSQWQRLGWFRSLQLFNMLRLSFCVCSQISLNPLVSHQKVFHHSGNLVCFLYTKCYSRTGSAFHSEGLTFWTHTTGQNCIKRCRFRTTHTGPSTYLSCIRDMVSRTGKILTEEEWRKKLSEEEYATLRLKATERPFTGEYNSFYPASGFFACRGCGTPLFSAGSKFNSGCGWPAFDKFYQGAIITHIDDSLSTRRRIEICCAKCHGHLGHVFHTEGFTPTGERHCVNSVSIKYHSGAPPESLNEVTLSL